MADLDFSHGGNIYDVQGRYRKKIIDFSANINPLGLPGRIKKAIYKNFARILHYPDRRASNITQKIAKYWGIDKENILLGNGSCELIYLIMSTFKPKSMSIPVPTFSEYERAAKSTKTQVQFIKLKEKEDFRLNLSQFNKADVFFLCNPNNPTGNLILPSLRAKRSNLKDRLLRRDFVSPRNDSSKIVIDEAFMDFLPDQKNYTFVWKALRCKKIIVLRSFTKFFALPGLRIGYLVAHKEVIDQLKHNRPPWNTNCLAQLAAELIINDREYLKRTYKLIESQRQFLFEQLAKIGWLKAYPSVTNFLLLKIERVGMTATSLQAILLKKGILIRDCSNFRNLNDKYIRIAVRSHKENLKLITALKKVRWKI